MNNERITDNLNFGQSLFEVIVALALVAIVMTGVVSLATSSVRNSDYSRNNAVVTKYAQEAVEWMRQERDNDWLTLINNTDVTNLNELSWSSTATTIPGTNYTRSVTFVCKMYDTSTGSTSTLSCPDSDTNTVEAKITVSWTDGQGTHTVTSRTVLTDWRSM